MSVTAAAGFRAAGIGCGIKRDGSLDLALVAADSVAAAAAVFTRNAAAAPPVVLSRAHLAAGMGVRAVVLNSGCANAGTGAAGAAAARAMAEETAAAVGCAPEQVLVCSTGPIGPMLPLERVRAGIAAAAPTLSAHPAAADQAAQAILTTDSRPKHAAVAGRGYAVGGMAKGAGMMRPNMATMLAVVTTDAALGPEELDRALRTAVDHSFHAVNIDGAESTNDTVIVLASGASGVEPDLASFRRDLTEVCSDLAGQMVADAEGATRVVTLAITGADDDATARRLGMAVADSALLRASLHGGDPNWGRILGALGASGIAFDPAAVTVGYRGVTVARGGVQVPYDGPALLAALRAGDFVIDVTVGDGPGRAEVLTVDLSPDYVRFNAEPS